MYHLRSMKKEGKISKLFSKENGQLGLKVSELNEKKVICFMPDQKYVNGQLGLSDSSEKKVISFMPDQKYVEQIMNT